MNQDNRYKFFGKYKVDRWLIQGCMVLVFFYLFYVAYAANFQLDYYACIDPFRGTNNSGAFDFLSDKNSSNLLNKCENPFYTPTTWKNEQYLPPGEYGTKPGLLFKAMWYVVFGVFAIGFLINHFIHNRGGKADEGSKDNSSQ